jgi:hypothetical protein
MRGDSSVVFNKSRFQANIGLLLILLVGFGFGALLLMQSKSIESAPTPSSHTSSAVDSMPGMDMTADEMKVTPQNNSPVTLLMVFLGINSALIVSAVILKKVRSKRKMVLTVMSPTLELEGGRK